MKTSEQFARQLKFILLYLRRGSYTYSNARRAALKAGYSASYARKITSVLNWQEMARALDGVHDELKVFLEERPPDV